MTSYSRTRHSLIAECGGQFFRNSHQESLVQKTRLKQGKTEQPTVGIIDAQSIKSTLVSSESKGFDAGKRIKGIKRHIVVDTLEMVLAVVIQNASVQDRDGAMDVIAKLFETWNNIIKIFADNGYRGALINKVKNRLSGRRADYSPAPRRTRRADFPQQPLRNILAP